MSTFQHLSVSQLMQMQQTSPELQIVDIRDAASYETGHIDGAFNLNNENLAHYIADADMDLPIVVVCYHGISSQSAATYLNEQGFDEVFSLDGGYSAWHLAHL
ncbi:thiosulfate sulfurtransferase GlpE [Shewanella schlegeliana]|uniref:Thiosulfate sulfurtransferase GlpE n=1 Tax=Shewanella schlegeliana TaxID=190308 RepID=A0ABS1T380_9GAMM|nr:thiosulfate sulfurtransferase GlpE [Shewanella schlegeliana]MBL4915254.1 thiosulfate sulfurtransferase GlpE [Shewanella schlegeliana]MCL1111235.1 thiosulfate sulfurtransferase GlpE [Shewanella schlegeliana]GIU34081.1 thiosulfate sulfurtransferase GlpE [Shewanella schlegeliana]